ncbi:Protein of unknown function [Thalassovita litoralis]|jgi:hypothetical protein|uniref:ATP-dependent transcriptional regulator n=1 Tax=Thalassovita litoralis TaxID=1010611 RepID=A0A521E3L9_9RHOB|nr:DUF2927 domain-containing protein [Thalassovita litoralis]SMO78462.1 Protein of unknown function [Thalassovita litoralis]
MKKILFSFAAMALLTGCMATGSGGVASRAASSPAITLPPMKTFSGQVLERVRTSNADIARDFLDLSFRLESGRELDVFTRFEEPITVKVSGKAPASFQHDLGRLLGRLRNEAGIDIRQVADGPAGITINAVTRSEIQRVLPQAACFVVPNITRLSEYPRAAQSPKTDWVLLQERRQMAIFVPVDSPPQETRDCLHEELAQALGPLNDLYRLPDSVFNDDNIHTVLTSYDMLILRTYYAPELRNGMRRDQVAARLPRILARLNPAGQRSPLHPLPDTPRPWIEATQTALGPGTAPAQRLSAARKALAIAESAGWTDHRRAFSHYALGRLTQSMNAELALAHFRAAQNFYTRSPNTQLHAAHVAAQLAAYAISEGNGEEALLQTSPYLAVAARHENGALLSTLLMLRAEALDLLNRPTEAQAVRLDSLGWARYGIGSDQAVHARLREIAALSPLKRSNGQL